VLPRVTRPKSIATVVVVLSGTCERSSTPALAAVITASVVSGVISETDPTKVVLPTPKPPATTILTEVIAASPALPRRGGLELAKSTEHPFEQVQVRATLRVIQLMDPDQSFHRHVGDEHPGHAQRHPEHRRYLGYGTPVPAKSQDGLTLRAEDRKVAGLIM
jgi:hypothetical protein